MDALFEKIFNETNIAATYFDENFKLNLFNFKACEIWNINPEVLNNELTIVEFFEILREKQVYPEKDDFKLFCQTLIHYFGKLENTLISNLILANGKNFEENIIPYQNGLIILWEDTTKLWETTYNLNSYKNLYNRIVERIPLPTIIVGSNGLIDNFNLQFSRFFSLPLDFLEQAPHITELLNKIDNIASSDNTKAYLLGLLLSRKEFSYKLTLNNNTTIEISGFPLPNGNNFILFKDALASNNNNLDLSALSGDFKNLQDTMIIDLEQILSVPINTIIGFADMLNQNYLGELNQRQQDYLAKIISQAEFMKSELEHKIELTLYNNLESVNLENIDLNEVIVAVMQQIKPKINLKNIKVNLNLSPKINTTNSNFKLLTKLLTLTLFYIIEQNNHNSAIEIEVRNPKLEFIIKDNSKNPLFSTKELSGRYDLNLVISLIKLLNGTYKITAGNKAFRTLIISFGH